MSSKQMEQIDSTVAVPEEILQRLDSLQRALKDSQCQIEGLLQQTTTLLLLNMRPPPHCFQRANNN